MSVISSLVAQPNRIIIATEFVYGFGDKGATMDDLEKMLTPIPPQQVQVAEGAVDTDSGDSSGTTIAAKVLSEMLKLKILERTDNENLRVTPSLSGNTPRVEWTTRLHAYLFPILTSDDSAREHGQAELPEALCWLLQQSPTHPLRKSGGGHYNILVSQVVDDDPLCSSIRNDARYQNVIYWARYLGLAEGLVADMVIADPTRAIERRLPVLFGDERRMTVNAFIHRLGTHIPVLDGGAVWLEMQGRLRETLQAKERHLSEAISLAMLRLQQAGRIKLEGLSDATSWILEVGRDSKSVSHITYLENSK
jgi:hypothetical protein